LNKLIAQRASDGLLDWFYSPARQLLAPLAVYKSVGQRLAIGSAVELRHGACLFYLYRAGALFIIFFLLAILKSLLSCLLRLAGFATGGCRR
jgi:hypothetical protein